MAGVTSTRPENHKMEGYEEKSERIILSRAEQFSVHGVERPKRARAGSLDRTKKTIPRSERAKAKTDQMAKGMEAAQVVRVL